MRWVLPLLLLLTVHSGISVGSSKSLPSSKVDTVEPASTGDTVPGIKLHGTANIGATGFIDQLNISGVWDRGVLGEGVRIALLDSGIDRYHAAFVHSSIVVHSVVQEENLYDRDEGPEDIIGHGTAVASLIVGNDTEGFSGVAPGSHLLSVKVADKNGVITVPGLLAGIDMAVEFGVDIISLSLGGVDSTPELDILEEKIEEVSSKGILVVASAGNDGSLGNDHYTISSPGSSPSALTVGAVDASNALAIFSSEGPTQQLLAKPEVLAPGVGIEAANLQGGYSSRSGTSFSTPLVTGIAALVLSEMPSLSAPQVKSRIMQSGVEVLDPISQWKSGYILPDAFNAVFGKDRPGELYPSQYRDIQHERLAEGMSTSATFTLPAQSLNGWKFESTCADEVAPELFGMTIIVNVIVTHPGTCELKASYGDFLTTSQYTTSAAPRPERVVAIDIKHTITDSLYGADRLGGRSMQTLVNALEQDGYWFMELEDLDELWSYDAIFIPSAFSMSENQTTVIGNYENSAMTQTEYEQFYHYIRSGGRMLIDIGWLGAPNELDAKLLDHASLRTLLALLGIEIVNLSDPDTRMLRGTMNTSSFYEEGDLIVGSYILANGVPLAAMDSVVGVPIGGNSLVFNSRIWREEYLTYNSTYNTFISWWDEFLPKYEISPSGPGVYLESDYFATPLPMYVQSNMSVQYQLVSDDVHASGNLSIYFAELQTLLERSSQGFTLTVDLPYFSTSQVYLECDGRRIEFGRSGQNLYISGSYKSCEMSVFDGLTMYVTSFHPDGTRNSSSVPLHSGVVALLVLRRRRASP